MKRAFWGLGIATAGLGLLSLWWISHGEPNKASSGGLSSSGVPATSTVADNPDANSAPPMPPPPPFMSPIDWQQLHAAREAVLKANPELAAEYKQIGIKTQNQQKQIEAAMIKVDPQVAPIVAKLVELETRRRNGAHILSAVPGPE